MADWDLTVLGHIAFDRKHAADLRTLAYAAPNIATKLRQIAYQLDADADQFEKLADPTKVATGTDG